MFLDIRFRDWVWRVYPSELFSNLSTLPNENTLEVNVTHEQLSSLATAFDRQTAIAPTRYEEGASSSTKTPDGKGYDIKLDTAKELVFQHKAPTGTRVLGPDEEEIQWLKYRVNMTQIYNLVLQYNPGEAFLALPATPQQLHVREGLDRTVFVDVYAIFLHTLKEREETSWIYVEYIPSGRQNPHVIGKYKTREWTMGSLNKYPYYHLADRTANTSSHVYSWTDLKQHIEGCTFGLPIRGVRDSRYFDTLRLEPDEFSEDYDQLPNGFDGMDDFLEEFDPDYRGFIKRRFALNTFAKWQSEDVKMRYRNLLTSSIEERIRMGVELERLSIPEGVIFDFAEYKKSDEEWSFRKMFNTFDRDPNPLTKGLTGNCRYILEDGNISTTQTI